MNNSKHYRALESMYAAAPINDIFRPKLTVSDGMAEIEIELSAAYHHAAGAVHGSVYFKMLDDAAFFAANSYETEFFVLTTSFTTYLTRPVTGGKMTSVGRVVNKNRTQFVVEAVVYNEDGVEIGRGNGLFVRGKVRLHDAAGYLDA